MVDANPDMAKEKKSDERSEGKSYFGFVLVTDNSASESDRRSNTARRSLLDLSCLYATSQIGKIMTPASRSTRELSVIPSEG